MNTQHRIVRDLLIMIIMKTAIVLGVLTSFWVFKYIILMQSTGKVEILLGKSQNFQNLLPGFSSFTYQYVFTPVASCSLTGKLWREDSHSLLPSVCGV